MEKAIKIVSSMVKELKGPFNLEKAARILSILSVLFIVVGWFWSEPRRAYALTDEVRQIYRASHIVGVICLTLFGIALLLLRKKHMTNQRIIAAFALSIVAVTMLAAWSIVAALLPKGEPPPGSRFRLLCRLEDEDIQLHAISEGTQPSALVLFRRNEAFILNWKCDSYTMKQQMIQNQKDELYISDIFEIGKAGYSDFKDLHVLQFTEFELSEYCLRGEEYSDWFAEPVLLKEPLQDNINIVLFAEKEYPVPLRKTNDTFSSFQTLSYESMGFSLNEERKEVVVSFNVYAEYAGDDTGIYIGHVDANVHFNDGIFTLSDLGFVTVT